jgi:hypothetical protein
LFLCAVDETLWVDVGRLLADSCEFSRWVSVDEEAGMVELVGNSPRPSVCIRGRDAGRSGSSTLIVGALGLAELSVPPGGFSSSRGVDIVLGWPQQVVS